MDEDYEHQRLIHLFWARVQKGEGCWEWRGARADTGYGRTPIGRRGRGPFAHRFSYELHFGPIPTGLQVCHHCDNRGCVRPDHLFLGTARDNLRDMAAKGRQVFQRDPSKAARGDRHGTHTHPETLKRGEAHHNSRLTAEQVREIRARYPAEGITVLGRAFGVSKQNIRAIVTGRAWKHVA